MLPKRWDEQRKRIRKSHPNSQRLKKIPPKKLAEAEGVALDLETQDKYVAPKKIKEAVMGKAATTFVKYFEGYVDSLLRKQKLSTHDKAKAPLSKLKTFLNGEDLTFDQLTVGFLKKYESYLRDELGYSTNTIHSTLKIFRKLFTEAIDEELISFEKNPCHCYKLIWEMTKKEYLDEEDLKRLEELDLKSGTKGFPHRNMYVFAAYTGGLRISDILQLRLENFDGQNLTIRIQETDEPLSIKVPNKGLEILELYREPDSQPSNLIIPVLKRSLDHSDPALLFKAISSATAYTNTDLKALAKMIGVNQSMSFHTSRHAWATRALRKGMRIEYVSKLMGHSSVKTTQIYAKIVNAELDKAMDVFND